MTERKDGSMCQLHTVSEICEPVPLVEALWQSRNRLRRIVKRRYNYLLNAVTREEGKNPDGARAEAVATTAPLQAGDWVRVKSKEEIENTLNNWNQLRRCAFMEEMWPYCGTRQRVFKRVEKFLDERDYLMKKCKGIVLLEGVFCQGTIDFGACDRSCHFFWREEWLEKEDADCQMLLKSRK